MTIAIRKKKVAYFIYNSYIILLPILNIYRIGLPIGDIVGLVLFPYFALRCNKMKGEKQDKRNAHRYRIFLVYVIILLPIQMCICRSFDLSDVLSRLVHIILYSMYGIFFSFYLFDYDFFCVMILKIACILAPLTIIQQIIYRAVGIKTYLLLHYLDLNYSIIDYSEYVRRFNVATESSGYRASSIFLEPAHFCMYILIPLAIVFMKKNKRHIDHIVIMVICVSIICSYSTGGVFGLLICVFYYIILLRENQKKWFKVVLILFSSFAGIYILTCNTQLVSLIVGRISEIGSNVYDTSGNRRVLRGFILWRKLPNLIKIFGAGVGMLQGTIIKLNLIVLTDVSYSEEMNTYATLLCTNGIIGTVLYCRSIITEYKKKNELCQLITILFLLTSIFNNYIYQAISVLYLVFVFTTVRRKKR